MHRLARRHSCTPFSSSQIRAYASAPSVVNEYIRGGSNSKPSTPRPPRPDTLFAELNSKKTTSAGQSNSPTGGPGMSWRSGNFVAAKAPTPSSRPRTSSWTPRTPRPAGANVSAPRTRALPSGTAAARPGGYTPRFSGPQSTTTIAGSSPRSADGRRRPGGQAKTSNKNGGGGEGGGRPRSNSLFDWTLNDDEFNRLLAVDQEVALSIPQPPPEFHQTELPKLGAFAGPTLSTGRRVSQGNGDYSSYVAISTTGSATKGVQLALSQMKDVSLRPRSQVVDIVNRSVTATKKVATTT